MISMRGAPFFKKPDFQLRAFGASPSLAFMTKESPSRSRQPAIVADVDSATGALRAAVSLSAAISGAAGCATTAVAIGSVAGFIFFEFIASVDFACATEAA